METTSIVGFERADGSVGRVFIGSCDDPELYAMAVRTAVAEARRDGGRHIVVKLIEADSGRIISAVYARETGIG